MPFFFVHSARNVRSLLTILHTERETPFTTQTYSGTKQARLARKVMTLRANTRTLVLVNITTERS